MELASGRHRSMLALGESGKSRRTSHFSLGATGSAIHSLLQKCDARMTVERRFEPASPLETRAESHTDFGGSHGDQEGASALARDYSGFFPPRFAEGKSVFSRVSAQSTLDRDPQRFDAPRRNGWDPLGIEAPEYRAQKALSRAIHSAKMTCLVRPRSGCQRHPDRHRIVRSSRCTTLFRARRTPLRRPWFCC